MTESFFKKPKAVIASPNIYPDTCRTLESFGIKVLYSCCNLNVSKYLAYHADMQLAQVSPSDYISAPECYEYYKGILKDYSVNLLCGNTYLSCNYPDDIAYNIIVTQKNAFHNFKHTDTRLLSFLSDKTKVNLSQGYTSCTLCMIGENECITSDKGIFKTLSVLGFDVLCVDDTNISLPGFDHGFIGGASFMLSEQTLAVNGDIRLHRDCDKILSFCQKHGVNVVSLSKKSIMDIGSFLPVF